MPNRILREGILESQRVDKLSPEAEVFFRRLMSIVDDYGRFEVDAFVIRGKCYLRRIERVSTDDVLVWLFQCVAAGLIVLYRAGTKLYLEISDFKQQRRSKSKYPGPEDGEPLNAEQMIPLAQQMISGARQVKSFENGSDSTRLDSTSNTFKSFPESEVKTETLKSQSLPSDQFDRKPVAPVSDLTVDLEQRLVNVAALLTEFMGAPPDDHILLRVEAGLHGADEEQFRDFLLGLDPRKFAGKTWPYLARVVENNFGSLARRISVPNGQPAA